MNVRKGLFVLAVILVLGGTAAWAQGGQHLQLPVSGEYYEPSISEKVAYSGTLNLFWTRDAAGGAGWRVTAAFDAEARSLASDTRFTYHGISKDNLNVVAGSQLELTELVWATGAGIQDSFLGSLKLAVQIPKDLSLPAAEATTAEAVAITRQASVPVAGSYYEPVIGDTVRYWGTVHVTWSRGASASSSSGWTVSSSLVADAQAADSGNRFTYHGFCQGFIDAETGVLTKLSESAWASGTGSVPFFPGSLKVALAMLQESDVPAVSLVALTK